MDILLVSIINTNPGMGSSKAFNDSTRNSKFSIGWHVATPYAYEECWQSKEVWFRLNAQMRNNFYW